MDAVELVSSLYPGREVRELAAGANRIFRLGGSEGTSIVKVYPVASRERRERRALEELAQVPEVPKILAHGVEGEGAWLEMSDGGRWNLASLPKNHAVLEAAGAALLSVHRSGVRITNLSEGIDSDYVASHYLSTIERLGRYRRRFEMEQEILDRARQIEPPRAGDPVPSHTKPVLAKFVVAEDGKVTIVDWEWATLAPPEWDLTLALWQMTDRLGADAAESFRRGYDIDLPDQVLRSWKAYHAAMLMLEAAEQREGRLGDLRHLVDDLAVAVHDS